MCGITGFLDLSKQLNNDELRVEVARMAETIRHRGPDDYGSWVNEESGIAMGFRRLAILDLSETGRQPMISINGRYVIVFNGEVYNFAELRQELENLGHTFRGRSDTEVMLAAICEWDVKSAVKLFNGMFAFALWDRKERYLHLVRDRIGIKPLYYGWMGKVFLFGSELKSLRIHPAFRGDIDRDTLALYLRHNYIPAPYSIYKGIYKLQPGTIYRVGEDLMQSENSPKPYWSAKQVVQRGISNPFRGTEEEAVEEFEVLLKEAVRLRMVADVPLGAFLSGGVDSSTIVALMQTQSNRPIKTYTIGFTEQGYNEAQYAKAIAQAKNVFEKAKLTDLLSG